MSQYDAQCREHGPHRVEVAVSCRIESAAERAICFGLSREERAERFTALVKETNKKRLAILSDEQKLAFKEIQGEKFKLPED